MDMEDLIFLKLFNIISLSFRLTFLILIVLLFIVNISGYSIILLQELILPNKKTDPVMTCLFKSRYRG